MILKASQRSGAKQLGLRFGIRHGRDERNVRRIARDEV
jgi:hypothetical protein